MIIDSISIDWLPILALLIAIVSAVMAWRANTTAKKTRKYEILTKRINEYGSEEMLLAISNIMSFFEEDEDNFAKIYVDRHREYRKSNLENRDPVFKELHHHRRIISTFYSVLAWAWDEKYIKMKTIKKFWAAGTLQIIPKVILPIEEGLFEDLNKNGTDKPEFFKFMRKLYNEASKE